MLVLLVACVPNECFSQKEPVNGRTEAARRLSAAYEILQTDPAQAATLLEGGIALDPSNVVLRRQLGSVYVNLGRHDDALGQFSVADHLLPSDTTRLQIAYLLHTKGRNTEAHESFSSLTESDDPLIRAKARVGVAVLTLLHRSSGFPWWGKIYSASFYDTRFSNGVFAGALYAGYFLNRTRTAALFGTVGVSRDTRSSGGAVPEIFSDNALIVGTGLRFTPLNGLQVDVQGGVGIDLIRQSERRRVRGDFRLVASYGNGLYSLLSAPQKVAWPFKPFLETYWSAGYYTRYENTIAYGQLLAGLRLAELNLSALDVYLRGDVTGDTRREFYNNVVEAGAGIRLTPDYTWGVSLVGEYHRGTYWDRGLATGSLVRSYNSVRFFLIINRDFVP